MKSTIIFITVFLFFLFSGRSYALNGDWLGFDHSIGTLGTPYEYEVGAGIYDITGPAADLGMMGYAMEYLDSAFV